MEVVTEGKYIRAGNVISIDTHGHILRCSRCQYVGHPHVAYLGPRYIVGSEVLCIMGRVWLWIEFFRYSPQDTGREWSVDIFCYDRGCVSVRCKEHTQKPDCVGMAASVLHLLYNTFYCSTETRPVPCNNYMN